jgi:hypothetical protein
MKKYIISFAVSSKKLGTRFESSFELETKATTGYAAGKEAEERVKLYAPMFAPDANVVFEIIGVNVTKERKAKVLAEPTKTEATTA